MDVSAIWVRRNGDIVQLLFESGGKWFVAAAEYSDAPFSHIVELNITGRGEGAGKPRPLSDFKPD